jgi:hypothetical protein
MKTFTLSFLFVVASLFAGASSAQISDADQAFSVLEQAIATFNARDYAAYEQLVADDFEAYTGVYTPLRFVGKASWMAFLRGLDPTSSGIPSVASTTAIPSCVTPTSSLLPFRKMA